MDIITKMYSEWEKSVESANFLERAQSFLKFSPVLVRSVLEAKGSVDQEDL